LKLDGVTSKAWTTQDGKVREGKAIDKGMIYKLLNNRTYLGELRHKEQWVPAAHPPIIERELWDRVHAILATNCRVRGGATQAVVPFLLKGIVFGNDGRALSPWHSTKKSNGRRYRYYIPMRDTKEQAGASGLPRLPAANWNRRCSNSYEQSCAHRRCLATCCRRRPSWIRPWTRPRSPWP
jgi:site-specific DNA recombinase